MTTSPTRFAAILVLLVVFWIGLDSQSIRAVAQDAENDKSKSALETIRDATVFIQVDADGERSTGSGFYIKTKKGNRYVVTNAHVVSAYTSLSGYKRLSSKVRCQFLSGQPGHVTMNATVLYTDEELDLALLTVDPNARIPDPFELEIDTKVLETMPVQVFGFPFGSSLRLNDNGPSVSVIQTSVSGRLLKDNGEIRLLQLVNGVHPGSSGGPIATKEGRLAGITVAKVHQAEIGFAIPSQYLSEIVNGRYQTTSVRRARDKRFQYVKIDFSKSDFENNMESGEVVFFPFNEQQLREWPNLNGGPFSHPASKTYRIYSSAGNENHYCSADSLPVDWGEIAYQVHYKRKDLTEVWQTPVRIDKEKIAPRESDKSHVLDDQGPKFEARPTPGDVPYQLSFAPSKLLVHPDSGQLYAIDSSVGKIARVSRQSVDDIFTAKEESLRLPKVVIDGVFKQYRGKTYLFLAGREKSMVYIVDPDRWEITSSIDIPSLRIEGIQCSVNPEDPLVYVGAVAINESRKTFVIDMRKQEWKAQQMGPRFPFVISSDGNKFYTTELVAVKDHPDQDDATSEPRFYESISSRLWPEGKTAEKKLIVSSKDELLFFGDMVYQLPTMRPIRLQDGRIGDISKTKPIYFELAKDGIYARSMNTHRRSRFRHDYPVRKVADKIIEAAEKDSLVAMFSDIVDNSVKELIYFQFGKLVVEIPYSFFEDVDGEPFVRCNISSKSFKSGMLGTATLQAENDQAKLKILKAPKGMEVKEISPSKFTLSWTPGNEQVGLDSLQVNVRQGNTTMDVNLPLNVTLPFIELPLRAKGFRIVNNGAGAVLWNGPPEDWKVNKKFSNIEIMQNTSPQISYISFRSNKDNKTLKLPEYVDKLACSETMIAYTLTNSSKDLHFISLSQFVQKKSISLNEPLNALYPRSNGFSIVTKNSTLSYDAIHEKILNDSSNSQDNEGSSPKEIAAEKVVSSFIRDGVLIEERPSESTPVLLLEPLEIPTIHGSWTPTANPSNSVLISPLANKEAPRNLLPPGVREEEVAAIGKSHRVVIKADKNVSISSDELVQQLGTRFRLELQSSDGQSARFIEAFAHNDPTSAALGYKGSILADNKFVYFLYDKAIYRWAIPPELIKTEDAFFDFTFQKRQSQFVIREESSVLSHHFVSPPNAKRQISFFLKSRRNGLTINKETGQVTCKKTELLQAMTPVIRRMIVAEGSYEKAVQTLGKKSEELANRVFQRIGVSTEGIPFAVPIEISAVDSDNQTTELKYYVLVDYPLKQAAAIAREFYQ